MRNLKNPFTFSSPSVATVSFLPSFLSGLVTRKPRKVCNAWSKLCPPLFRR